MKTSTECSGVSRRRSRATAGWLHVQRGDATWRAHVLPSCRCRLMRDRLPVVASGRSDGIFWACLSSAFPGRARPFFTQKEGWRISSPAGSWGRSSLRVAAIPVSVGKTQYSEWPREAHLFLAESTEGGSTLRELRLSLGYNGLGRFDGMLCMRAPTIMEEFIGRVGRIGAASSVPVLLVQRNGTLDWLHATSVLGLLPSGADDAAALLLGNHLILYRAF